VPGFSEETGVDSVPVPEHGDWWSVKCERVGIDQVCGRSEGRG
jgi:hypothetical protein